MRKRTYDLTLAAVITAAYVVLTLPFAQFSFGIVQFRLAEAMTVLAVLSPAAIPGLTLGCLLANLLNPMNLGPVDIIGGTLATLIAAWMSWNISIRLRTRRADSNRFDLMPVHTSANQSDRLPVRALSLSAKAIAASPAVVINALVVGTYLPFLLLDEGSAAITTGTVLASIVSILLCEAVVVYLIGLPLLTALAKTKISR